MSLCQRGHDLFVYGTLMVTDVLGALLGRLPEAYPARLNGYFRHAVKGAVYPGIRPSRNLDDSVDGVVLRGLEDWELRVLDEFEDEQYSRESVIVRLVQDLSVPIKALCYIWKDEFVENLDENAWSMHEHFDSHRHQYFLFSMEFASSEKILALLPDQELVRRSRLRENFVAPTDSLG